MWFHSFHFCRVILSTHRFLLLIWYLKTEIEMLHYVFSLKLYYSLHKIRIRSKVLTHAGAEWIAAGD